MATSKLTTKQQVESIWELGGLIPLQLIKNVWKQIDEDNVLGLAADWPTAICSQSSLSCFFSCRFSDSLPRAALCCEPICCSISPKCSRLPLMNFCRKLLMR